MLRQFDLGRTLSAAGAVLLLVSLFLKWYDEASAWESFEVLDLALAALALATIAAALREDVVPDTLLRWLPVLAFAVVALQLIHPPPVIQLLDDVGGGDTSIPLSEGAWLGLAATALMSAGAVLGLARISISVDVADRRSPAEGPDGTVAGSAATPPTPHDAPTTAPAPRGGSLFGGPRRPEPDEVDAPPPPAREPEPTPPHDDEVREVPAVDRRQPAPSADEPDPTQPLRLPPDAQ
ncbi:hypothetical protein [Conexibacter sp. SYSU D00693]|uniref:hypothetical protein n=1 Tax=Conexibacter sp. SYSU D00693 TaxID=2812560 RepID=UPI00196B8D1C|nr:hypothetical protein [Conexibacter sp. SYSU D00693]